MFAAARLVSGGRYRRAGSAMIVNVVNDLSKRAARPADVAERLRPVLLKLARELRREVAALGVTGGQVSLMNVIRRAPGTGVRELAARERMSPAGMSGHIDRLERAGLVRRAQDESDRRRHGLTLTKEGERVWKAARSLRTAWLAERLKRLSPEELELVEGALDPLASLLEDAE
jgi:DNA-binding MarR family transcriptional regulator